MLRKFKEWLTNENSTLSVSPTQIPQKVSQRVRLSQSHILHEDGTLFEANIGTDEDTTALLTVQKACYNGETPWDAAALHHELKRNTNAFYIVIRQLERPVAFIGAWLVEKEAHITNVAVVPQFQRKGIATWLINELSHISADQGMDILSLEVRISNEKAQHLYRKLGFADGKIKRFYYSNNHEDALEMSLSLR